MSKTDSSTEVTIEKSVFDDIKKSNESCPAKDQVTVVKKSSNCSIWSIVLFISTFALSGVVFMERKWNKEEIAKHNAEFDKNLCITDACIHTASQITSRMNLKVDPCTNFHEYACGNWNELNPIPEEYSRYTTYGKMSVQVRQHIKTILEGEVEDGKLINKAKTLYNACTDTRSIDKSGVEPLKEVLKEFEGGWPIINSKFNKRDYSFEKYIAKLSEFHQYALLESWVNEDDLDLKTNIFQFDEAKTVLRASRFAKEKYADDVERYTQLIVDVAMVLGGEEDVVKKDAEEMVKFEKEIALLTLMRDSYHSKDYNRMTVKEMQEEFDEIEWVELINELLKAQDHKVNEDTLIGNYGFKYIKDLNKLLKKTEERVVANFIVWRLVRSSINDVANNVFQPLIQKSEGKLGFAAISARWKYCARLTNYIFPQLTGREFIERYFDPKMKSRVLDMIKKLTASFTEMVKGNTWMDAQSKKKSLTKIDQMTIVIGYDDEILNDEYLKKLYEEYNLVDGEFYKSLLSIWKVHGFDEYKRINEKTPKPRKHSYKPTTVNAYHSSSQNKITFPAGILQPPVYDKDYIRALNYGGIGVVIGHEITHGFDNHGRQYDGLGKKVENMWPEKQIATFLKKAKCYADQYGKFKHGKTHLNGTKTMNENIADNGGLLESFNAYRKFVEQNGEEKKIPILNFSNDKMFYIGFGQVWCEKIREWRWPSKLRNSVHSPGVFRVLGTLQNSKKFAETFNCPKNSYMNPEEKCKIW